ncbi:MAG: hypothetical protein IKZ93_09115 [Prevotella sp.]|nr:hypothetical protein [Prevotella sp.]
MTYLLLALVALGVFSAIISLFSHNKDGAEDVMVQKNDCSTCLGDNEKCEQECMMEAAIRDIEYFDDEELDAFKGRTANSYSDEEAEQFREILYSMRQEEVKDWSRSLVLRGIELPDQVKDEVYLMHNS